MGYPNKNETTGEAPVDLRSLLEKAPVVVLHMRADGIVVYASPAVHRLTGYTAAEVTGRAFWDEVSLPEDRSRLQQARQAALNAGVATVTVRFFTRDRHLRAAEWHLFAEEHTLAGLVLDATARHELQEALFQSELLNRTFLEQSPLGLLHLDADGTVTFENHPFRQLVGERAEDAWIGLNLFDMPGLDVRLRGRVKALLSAGEAFHGAEVSFLRPAGGGVRHLLVHGSPIRNPDGCIVGGVLMVEDVTRTKEQQEALSLHDRYARAEAELRSAALAHPEETPFLRAAAAMLGRACGADRAHILVHNTVDDYCASRTVWSAGDHRPDPLVVRHREIAPLREPAPPAAPRSIHAHAGTPETRVLLHLTGAAEALWIPFYETGRRAGFVLLERVEGRQAAWSDTERACIEQLVEVFETLWTWVQVDSRYRLTLSTIDDALFHFTFSETGTRRYVFITPQVEALVGYEPAALLAHGETSLDWSEALVHPDDRAHVRAHDERLRSGHESRVIYRIRHRDGSLRWLREHGTPLRDAAGHVTVSGILTDVTEQKQAEELLVQAKQEAERASRLKTAFIATMSHEIRTPLGAVHGFAELLAAELKECGTELPPEVHEFAEAIRDRADHLLGLVNDLFDLSNMELGGLPLERVPLDLHALLHPLLDDLTSRAARKNLTVHRHFAPDAPVVLGDARRIEQIFRNLFSNALKFTESGGVTVRTRRLEREVLVEVSDTGVGMARDYLDRLFTPFTQEEDWRNRRFEGTGLGLALVKRLLDRLGGRIEVESEKGKGTTFRVFLPAGDR
ncbi:MAG: hypothetical protein KatS3mg043_1906 [Rhodothermaceae bacterium]|nr:MAG: hypothetical protein KatS3mg043_1906 [Rhodothermaceae bacterium]